MPSYKQSITLHIVCRLLTTIYTKLTKTSGVMIDNLHKDQDLLTTVSLFFLTAWQQLRSNDRTVLRRFDIG